jgi:hypothetical protein
VQVNLWTSFKGIPFLAIWVLHHLQALWLSIFTMCSTLGRKALDAPLDYKSGAGTNFRLELFWVFDINNWFLISMAE